MSENKRIAVWPRAPHPDSLREPSYNILDRSGKRLLCWCPRHRCGAIYHLEEKVWSIETPLTFDAFLRELQRLDILPKAGTDDMARWLDACTQPPPGTPTAPGGWC